MAFNSYEELKAAVEERRQSILTLEVDMGSDFSQAHEDAKSELAQAKAMKAVVGEAFLGDDGNIERLEQAVKDTRPEPNLIWVQYRKLDLDEWSKLVSTAGLKPMDQYERVLPKTFVGVFGKDPVRPDDLPEDQEWVKPDPLTTDAASLSSRGPNGILPGGSLHSVVQTFMAWQNSGGDVNIRPTKSGLV
jgi:hypothetical protein